MTNNIIQYAIFLNNKLYSFSSILVLFIKHHKITAVT